MPGSVLCTSSSAKRYSPHPSRQPLLQGRRTALGTSHGKGWKQPFPACALGLCQIHPPCPTTTATGPMALPVPCWRSPGTAQPSETPQGTPGDSSQDPVCLQHLTAHPKPSPSSHFSHVQPRAQLSEHAKSPTAVRGHPEPSMRLLILHPQLNTGTMHPQHHALPSPHRPHWCPGCCHSWSLLNGSGKQELFGAAAGSRAAAPRSWGRCRAPAPRHTSATSASCSPKATSRYLCLLLPSAPRAIQVSTSHLFPKHCVYGAHANAGSWELRSPPTDPKGITRPLLSPL